MASGEDRDREETENDEKELSQTDGESNSVDNSEKESQLSDNGIVSPSEEDIELLQRQVAEKKSLKKKLEKEALSLGGSLVQELYVHRR